MPDVTINVKAVDNATGVLRGVANFVGGAFQFAFGGLLRDGILAATDALRDLTLGSVGAASSLSESLNKVNVVFGEAADEVIRFADNAALGLGQSRAQALEAAGTYGNLLTSIGLLPDAAADMSISLVTLASDLASFNNASPTETLLALRSALTGEFEPMRRFGAALSAASVEAKALELGLAATTEEITPAIKAQAAYALILEQTTNAQGDFARTSEGLANSQRTLSAVWQDLKATIGQAVVPALEGLIQGVIMPAIPTVQAFAQNFSQGFGQQIPAAVAQVQAAAKPVFDFLIGALPQVSEALAPVREAVLNVAAAFAESMPRIQQYVADMAAFVMAQVNQLSPQLIENISTTLNQLAIFWENHGETIMAVVNFAFRTIATTVGVVLNSLTSVIAAALQLINGDFEGAWTTIVDMVRTNWEMILSIVGTNLDAFMATWRGNWELAKTIVVTIWNQIVEAVRATIARFVEIGSGIIDGIISGIRGAVGRLVDAAIAAALSALAGAKAALGIESPSKVFAGIGANMMEGMAQGITQNAGKPVGAVQAVSNATTNQYGSNTYNFYGVQADMEWAYLRAQAGSY